MRVESIYYADDGTEFETEEECIAYENGIKDCIEGIHFYDESLHRVTTPDNIASYAIYAYIVDIDKAVQALIFISNLYGQNMPKVTFSKGDILKWDEHKDDWFNLTIHALQTRHELNAIHSFEREKDEKN